MRPLLPFLFLAASSLSAQHSYSPGGPFDPAVPTPQSVLGYEVGDRFTPHHMIVRYAERLAMTSRRIRVDTVARTFEGREAIMVIATSEANHARIQQIRGDAKRIGDPRGISASELGTVTARMPSIAWLGYTVHGGEASGTEAALALMYQLAAGRDVETQRILDSVVVLIDPVQNPDGHERHVQDVMRNHGALGVPTTPGAMIHQGNWPGPRTSHYYFDLNRDWFLHSHPETRGRVRTFLDWHPHVAVDLHEMGSNSTYFFAPPMEPINKNVHSSILKWWDLYAGANAAAFDRHGWSYFRREGYDEFYPGYGVSWPILTGAVGMTYEQASSGGGAIRRTDGTILTLREASHHHYTAAWATLLTTANRRTERVRDFAAFRQTAITDAASAPMRAIVIERDAQGRADSLAARLMANGIEVRLLTSAGGLRDATPYGHSGAAAPAGNAYVVDIAQPQGRLAKALLEPDAELDSAFIRQELESRRTNQPERFYDMTAWALPYTFRVRAWTTRAVPPDTRLVQPFGRDTLFASPPPTAPAYGYAFAPGSDESTRLLAALLRDSVRVWYAPRAFRVGNASFPMGAFIVRRQANDDIVGRMWRAGTEAGGSRMPAFTPLHSALVDAGTDLGSNSVIPIRSPRVALVGGSPIQGNSFGFSWYTFDQRLGYPVTTVAASNLAGMLPNFDVIVIPSVGSGALDATLGTGGRSALGAWVRSGGVLITLDGATAWLATEQAGLSRLRPRRDSARVDSAGGAPLPTDVPGAILRAVADTLSPLLAGVRPGEVPVLMFSDRIYTAPRDLRAGEAVIRYAPESRLRLAGYMWPEVPSRVANSPYLWTERVGRGRVIAFAGDPNFRDMWRGLLPIFANAVFLGGSF
ncbi:MAG TPA: M14 family metallopeptidase [Gemmatimonadaceae bacterium]|nr:M14 family metallopeptidase [Gemmatimonadaceae bacterium]